MSSTTRWQQSSQVALSVRSPEPSPELAAAEARHAHDPATRKVCAAAERSTQSVRQDVDTSLDSTAAEKAAAQRTLTHGGNHDGCSGASREEGRHSGTAEPGLVKGRAMTIHSVVQTAATPRSERLIRTFPELGRADSETAVPHMLTAKARQAV